MARSELELEVGLRVIACPLREKTKIEPATGAWAVLLIRGDEIADCPLGEIKFRGNLQPLLSPPRTTHGMTRIFLKCLSLLDAINIRLGNKDEKLWQLTGDSRTSGSICEAAKELPPGFGQKLGGIGGLRSFYKSALDRVPHSRH